MALKKSMMSSIERNLNEHSQYGSLFWAWLKKRHETSISPQISSDENTNIVLNEASDFPLESIIYNILWGSIPFIYSFADDCQLLPVCMKSIYDNSDGKPNSVDYLGQSLFNEFN